MLSEADYIVSKQESNQGLCDDIEAQIERYSSKNEKATSELNEVKEEYDQLDAKLKADKQRYNVLYIFSRSQRLFSF